jgi:hypothetical protein
MSVSPQSLARTRDKRSHKVPARFNDTVYALKDATTPASTIQQQVTATPQKQPISNSTIATSKDDSSSSSSVPAKKKASKGISLIVKQQQQSIKQEDLVKPSTPRQPTTATISGGVSNFYIHQSSQPVPNSTNNTTPNAAPSTPLQATAATPVPTSTPTPTPTPTPAPAQPTTPAPTPTQATIQQAARYLNNLSTNQQYGTRLLINEPIYLPRSVATIAPITTTLHQIALQARKPPFISKKAEVCLAYQDERKLNYLTSNFAALIRITKYLSVTDRLNLRCVNRTWKSVIDSEAVWKEVLVNSCDADLEWKFLLNNYLIKHGTTDIIFKEYEASESISVDSLYKVGLKLPMKLRNLKRIFIKSVNKMQNSIACIILKGLLASRIVKDTERVIRCDWDCKVGVDPLGIATANLHKSVLNNPPLDEPLIEINDVRMEIHDLKDMYEYHPLIQIKINPI